MPSKASPKKQERKLCNATTKAGEPCNRSAFVASDGTAFPQCRWHVPKSACPELDEARRANAVAGGKTKRYRAVVNLDQADITSAQDIAAVLAAAVKGLNDGDLDPRRAQALTGISGALLRALELSIEETRLAELEARLGIGNGTSAAVDEETAGPWVEQ